MAEIPTVTLGLDLAATFDPQKALTLVEACKLIRGRNGRLCVDIARRWSTRGCRPAGERGPRLILPTVKWCGRRLTMESWILAFEAMRARIAVQVDTAPKPRLRTRREAEEGYRKAMEILTGK